MQDIANDMERQQTEWIAGLRAAGIKAAHPDDGWVDRENNIVTLCYPQFNDGIEPGDLIALGWPKWHGKDRHRIVRILGRAPQRLFSIKDEWLFIDHSQ
jgi:hypothetical protein